MSDLFGNHIVGFSTSWLLFSIYSVYSGSEGADKLFTYCYVDWQVCFCINAKK